MNTPEQEKRKPGKLLVKAAVISVLVAAAAMVLSGTIFYMLFRQRALASMKKNLIQDASVLNREFYQYASYTWLLSYWKEYAEEMKVPPYEGDIKVFLDWFTEASNTFIDTAIENVSFDKLSAMSPEEQKLFAEYCYYYYFDLFSSYSEIFDNDSISCYSLTENGVFNYFTIRKADEGKVITEIDCGLGADVPFHLDHHPELQKILSSREGISAVETYRSTTDGKEYSAAYATILGFDSRDPQDPQDSEIKIQAVVSVTRSMEALNQTIWTDVFRFEGWIALVIGIVIAFELIGLYYGMIRPTLKLQKEIRNYTKTWDSQLLTESLSKNRPGNELGQLSDDLILMGKEIDLHVREVEKATAEKERLGAELDVASKIQTGVLPKLFSSASSESNIGIYASMTPAKEVGGDLYDFFYVDDDHLALVIGDVSGKGIPAALFMVTTKALLKSALKHGGSSPKAVLSAISDLLCEGNEEWMFVTVWLGILELSTGRMLCSNAGHELPVLRRKKGSFAFYRDEHGVPVAAMEGAEYEDYELDLSPGDTLFVYSDGLPEAINDKDEQFGEERLLATLNETPDKDPKTLIENMTRRVEAFVGDRDPFDDLTMLCVKLAERDTGGDQNR